MQSKKCAHARYTNVDTYAYGSVRMYVYVYVRTYIIAYPLLVVPWEGKPSRWFLAGMAHYIYRCYIYKAPHTYTYVRMRMYMPAPAVLCSGSAASAPVGTFFEECSGYFTEGSLIFFRTIFVWGFGRILGPTVDQTILKWVPNTITL